LYDQDDDFVIIYKECFVGLMGYYKHGNFIFREKVICIPKISLILFLTKEEYEGGLIGHFGAFKTLEIRKNTFVGHICSVMS